jgi:cytochrome P450
MPIFQTTAYNTSQKQDQSPDHATIFHEILAGDLPAEEKTFNRLRKEGMSLLGAGTETVAWTLSVTTYHILANPEIHLKLIQELRPIFEKARGQPSWTQLEQLPYLNSVISEGLRLSFGVSAPLPRIAPDEILVFREWTIPAGVR